MQVWSLGCDDPLEPEMATYSSILAWKISWTVKPGRLQSMGSPRVGHDWATKQQQRLDLAWASGHWRRTRSAFLGSSCPEAVGITMIFKAMRCFPLNYKESPSWVDLDSLQDACFVKIHTDVWTDTHKTYSWTSSPGVQKSLISPGFCSDWANNESWSNFD